MNNTVPNSWETAPLGDLGEWQGGGTPSKAVPTYWNGTIPWVSPKDMKTTSIVDAEDHITEVAIDNSATALVPDGTVLMVTRSGILAHTFPIAVTKRSVALNQDLKALVPHYGLDSQFIAWALRRYAQDILGKCSKHGTTVHSIETPRLKQFEIPIAPAAEQRRIIEKIDELFSLIEAGEQTLARARKLLERYRQSVLNAAVTGELTKDWRERHKGEIESGEDLLQRILKARRAAWEKAELAKMHARGKPPINDQWKHTYKDPQPPNTSALPKLPNGWAWASLEMLTDIVGGITVDAKRSGSDLREVPYLRVANVQRGRLDLSEIKTLMAPAAKIDALRLMPGDILLNEGGDRDKIGRGWVWEGEIETCIHQNHVFRARSYLAEIPSRYISYYANEMGRDYFFSQGKQTTNLASINLTKVSHLPIPVPSAVEAVEIVELLDEACSLVDYLVADSAVQAVEADRLRQSILAAAFSGKLIPQDPADEPASVLLERVREQRSSAVLKAGRRLSGRRGRPSKERETAMTLTRKEVKPTHLRDILRAGDGTMEAGSLWKTSDLDIDDFYKQLRDELAAGHLREDRDGDVSKIICL